MSIPEWRLPPGVGHSLWDYLQADHIADDYDDYFAYNRLFQFDEAVLRRHFRTPGTLIDLGCGTGRLVLSFAASGFQGIALDLSLPMLRVVGQKARARDIAVDRVLANLAQLECFADGAVDYCVLMFSTLGMIQGAATRQRVIEQARRIVKPGGKFAIHVHNRWYNIFDPEARWWLLGTQLGWGRRRGLERGDKIFDYRGIPNMRLHLFSRRELMAMLTRAGFTIRELIRLDTERQQPLRQPWFFGDIRANGWIAVCD